MLSTLIAPTDDQLDTAILWLQDNEGDGSEGENCRAVANWLDAFKNDRFLRYEARKAGVPVAALRRRLLANKTGNPQFHR